MSEPVGHIVKFNTPAHRKGLTLFYDIDFFDLVWQKNQHLG